jgi:amidase
VKKRLVDPILHASASALAKSIRDRHLSSVEVVGAYLRRIEEINPSLNAVFQVQWERARERAVDADQALAQGRCWGPLHGVPMTIKDSLDTQGVVTTAGTLGRRNYKPREDATVVRRLYEAGAVLLGKTNTSELTLSFETDNLVYGRTKNPYDLERTPGGSSGGAAALVAAGGSPFDIGSDTSGSLRVPCHYCGIAGIKPTFGRVSRAGHIISQDARTQLGPMARAVDDLFLTLPLLLGVDWRDPSVIPMPWQDSTSGTLERLRVAMYTDDGISPADADTTRVIHAVAECFAEAGVNVSEARPEALARVQTTAQRDSGWIRRLLERCGTQQVHDSLRWTAEAPTDLSAAEYARSLENQGCFVADMTTFLARFDAILCPVRPTPAPRLERVGDPSQKLGRWYTAAFNVTGWPAVVVRGGSSREGLPIGVQIVARPWMELNALALAKLVEAHSGGWQPPR